MRKRVVIDLDGVLAEWNEPFRRLMNNHGASIFAFGPNEPTQYMWTHAHRPAERAAWAHIADNPSWWSHLPVHADVDATAKRTLHALHTEHDVTFVTARANGRYHTQVWLVAHFVPDPHLLLTPGEKALALCAIQPHVVIDDRETTLVEYAEREGARDGRLLILVDRPWNRAGRTDHYITARDTTAALELARDWCRRGGVRDA